MRPDALVKFQASNLEELAAGMQACTHCDLYRFATQAVTGEGPIGAKILMVAEQPGDREDIAGKPFVGPAGALLDRALADAGIDRRTVFVTNAVKHFSFEERGKRRIHKKPRVSELDACRPWLQGEISIVKPELIVCLGATAARSVLGTFVRVLDLRGKVIRHDDIGHVGVTIHPAAILRLQDGDEREREYSRFVVDLKEIKKQAPS